MTSKLQVTIPKAIAARYGIEPGADVEWLPAGEAIRVVPASAHLTAAGRERRLELFDAATERAAVRARDQQRTRPSDRGWARDDLYDRGA